MINKEGGLGGNDVYTLHASKLDNDLKTTFVHFSD